MNWRPDLGRLFGVQDTDEWEIHVAGRTYPVADGLTIGRAEGCEILLADALVSRHHARVSVVAGEPGVEDLRSRHGVSVNGRVISGRVALAHGDRIAISEHVLVLVDRAQSRRDKIPTLDEIPVRRPRVTATIREMAVTGEVDPAVVTLAETEAALVRGELPVVARGLAALREIVGELERRGGADPAVLRGYSSCALRAATRFDHPAWIDTIVDVHAIRGVPMHAATIDALAGALDRLASYDRAKLAAYVAALDASKTPFGMYEQFCLKRLSALAR